MRQADSVLAAEHQLEGRQSKWIAGKHKEAFSRYRSRNSPQKVVETKAELKENIRHGQKNLTQN